MKLNKNQAIVAALSITIVIMVVVTFYLRTFFFKDTSTSTVIQNQVKASNESYEKVLPINSASPTALPSVQPSIGTAGLLGTTTPSPTEIVLAYISPTGLLPTGSTTLSGTIGPTRNLTQSVSSPSAMVTKLQSLPQTGVITNAAIIMIIASTLIFVAFIF